MGRNEVEMGTKCLLMIIINVHSMVISNQKRSAVPPSLASVSSLIPPPLIKMKKADWQQIGKIDWQHTGNGLAHLHGTK